MTERMSEMDNNMDKKHPLNDMMRSTMEKVREMVDTNTIVGQPITTPDGVTLIPISKVSFGFGSGGGDYGKAPKDNFGGGSAAGVKIDPVAFLVIKDGSTRVLPVAVPPTSTMERIVEKVPDIMDKVEKHFGILPSSCERGDGACTDVCAAAWRLSFCCWACFQVRPGRSARPPRRRSWWTRTADGCCMNKTPTRKC